MAKIFTDYKKYIEAEKEVGSSNPKDILDAYLAKGGEIKELPDELADRTPKVAVIFDDEEYNSIKLDMAKGIKPKKIKRLGKKRK